jgi:hypothetical protein
MKIHKIFKDFIFAESSPGSPAVMDFEPTLFHSVDHLRLQRPLDWIWLYAQHHKNHNVVASLYLNFSDDVASSVVRSPFGTIECSETFPAEGLYAFLEFVEAICRNRNIERIILQDAPLAYAPKKSSMLSSFLFNLGYRTVRAEISSCLNIADDYAEGLNSGERQVLRKAHQAGLIYTILPNTRLDTVYEFIARHHQLKGYAISMELAEVQRTLTEFPERFVLSCVLDDKQIVAASLAIRINTKILYNFYMDHDPIYNKLSPPLMLMEGLFKFSKEHGIDLLDLGTSSLNGQPNFSLLDFKLRTGAFPSPKLRFEKVLDR